MIYELTGRIAAKAPGEVVLNVHGIGFGLSVSSRTEERVGAVGERAHLFTHLIVREDEWRLIGFFESEERECFLGLTAVNGVGPKLALAILGGMGVERLEAAVREGEWQRLKEIPGVGAKLAQRIQLELSSRWEPRLKKPGTVAPETERTAEDPVVGGLLGLGYSAAEAEEALAGLDAALGEGERLRMALRRLDRGKGGVGRG